MEKDYCEIIMVLDESGSMGTCKSDTIGGVNEFLNNQKRIKGKVKVTLVKFSDYYNIINLAVPLEEIVFLDEFNYNPSFTTALFDAVGKTVDLTGKRLAEMEEEKRPEKVIFVIITDGYENASTKFTREQIFDRVSHQREKYSWDFIFLGADIDAWGKEIGVQTNVRIDKNDLNRSYKGLAHHVMYCRLSIPNPGARNSFDMTGEELDRELDDLESI